jgi:hypothetical protein
MNRLRRSHIYITVEIDVIPCWLYRSGLVNRIVGYRCDFDFVVGIDITKNDDWVNPLPIRALFHSLPHDRNYLFLAKMHCTFEPGSLGVRYLSRGQ